MLFSMSLMTRLSTYKHMPTLKLLCPQVWNCTSQERSIHSAFGWSWSLHQAHHNFRASCVCTAGIPSVSGCIVELYKSFCKTLFYFPSYANLLILKAIFERLLTACNITLSALQPSNSSSSIFCFILLTHADQNRKQG